MPDKDGKEQSPGAKSDPGVDFNAEPDFMASAFRRMLDIPPGPDHDARVIEQFTHAPLAQLCDLLNFLIDDYNRRANALPLKDEPPGMIQRRERKLTALKRKIRLCKKAIRRHPAGSTSARLAPYPAETDPVVGESVPATGPIAEPVAPTFETPGADPSSLVNNVVEQIIENPPPAHIPDESTGEIADVPAVMASGGDINIRKSERKKLRDEYKAECKRAGEHGDHIKIAKGASKRWTSRTQVDKWLQCDPRYDGEADRLIRDFLTREIKRLRDSHSK